jgi:cystathionine beta-synthase
MIIEAEKKGLLKKGGTIVEATAGNTGIALSIIAIKRGYKVIIVVPNKMTVEKVFHLKALGAKVIVARSDVVNGHPEYYLEIAKKIAKEKKAFYINQFSNKANINSHVKSLGPEIYKQLNGKIDAFVAGVGTGGTISGVGRFLKSKNKKCELVLADPKGSVLKDLINTGKMSKNVGSWIVEGIGEDFCPPLLKTELIDYAYEISDFEAINSCKKLLQNEGILAGSSSGTLLAAAIKYCRAQKVKKNVVTLICDAGDKYLRKIYNESWRIKEGLNFKKKYNNIKDLVSHVNKSNIIPTVNVNAPCSLAFKLMHENNISFLLVETNKKKLVGVITEHNLLEKVSKGSFKDIIKGNITKVKKISLDFDLTKLVSLIKRENYLFVFDKNNFYGVINKTDVLWYLKKKENND